MKKYSSYLVVTLLSLATGLFALAAFAAVDADGFEIEIASSDEAASQHINDYQQQLEATAQADPAEDAVTSKERVATDSFQTASAVADSELDNERGTFNPATSGYLLANTSNLSSVNSVTGQNNISDTAFSNATGVVSVIQNSGNNVVIQSNTIVNLEMCQGEC